jgi:Asp-tRNA(Asn)/Glu-tRNA(Gln) amidotransferase A subunit family amidase
MAAFDAYERALTDNDLSTLDQLFAPGPQTIRGDRGGLLVGHEQVRAFRRVRGGAPVRDLSKVHVHVVDTNTALITAVTAPSRGGHGLQSQLWRRLDGTWAVVAAHVSAAPTTFDATVWRAVGTPLIAGAPDGPLAGETVAVKDVFAVAGYPTGAGVPAYLAEQPAAGNHAAAVARLLDAGAAVRGIAHTDQFAFSLAGDNPHYGTPLNAAVPAAVPGGSSSGPATAVALGDASIGLGTDTAGSIRVPASYQGLWGLRTTHGAVPTDGLVGLAPDFDTVGLLTRDPDLLVQATAALVDDAGVAVPGEVIDIDDAGFDLAAMLEAFQTHQRFQAWQLHGDWIRAHPQALQGSARARFEAASQITSAQDAAAQRALATARDLVDARVGTAILSLPSAASPAPRLWTSDIEVDAIRQATLRLTCVAGISGRPAVSVPADSTPAGPVGRSFVGPRGSDLALVRWAARRQDEVHPTHEVPPWSITGLAELAVS